MAKEAVLKGEETNDYQMLPRRGHSKKAALFTNYLLLVLETGMCYLKASETSQVSKRLKSNFHESYGIAEESKIGENAQSFLD